MAITSVSQAQSADKKQITFKTNAASYTAFAYVNFWRLALPPYRIALPAAPVATPEALDISSAGALPIPVTVNPEETRLLAWETFGFPNQDDTWRWLMVDRLWQAGGLSSSSTSLQSIPATAPITRYTNGIGNQIWLETYIAPGATGTTISISYTNENSVSGRIATISTAAYGGAGINATNLAVPAILQAGDRGVKSVESIQLAGTMSGAANSLAVAIVHPLANCGSINSRGEGRQMKTMEMDLLALGKPVILNDACVAFYHAGRTSAVNNICHTLTFGYF